MAGRFVRCSARKNFLTFQGLGRKDLGVPGRTTWRFKVRVTRIWEVTGYLREWFFLMLRVEKFTLLFGSSCYTCFRGSWRKGLSMFCLWLMPSFHD
ncbi:uncharacterized protein LOC123898107 isoform X12 [Trifolium pratense]|uniref:uncharacterized protein LOC123898107 isoform X12 n=1 Tax=Trifolium pratense TaxID=57577 RepID=UPI001E695A02|nr:uncharacterized protein LOC123898107 isoform X12 [Trifolium pratense]